MIRLTSTTLTIMALGVLCHHACSQTLISKLPSDGISATYEYTFSDVSDPADSETSTNTAMLTIQCVGTEKRDQSVYRWLEIHFQYRDASDGQLEKGKSVAKFLLEEKDIGNTRGLMANATTFWTVNTRFPETTKPSDSRHPWMLDCFQPGYEKPKTVKAKTINTAIGNFECTGTEYSVKNLKNFNPIDGKTEPNGSRKFTVFSSDDSPFGCVELNMEIKTSDGKKRYVKLKLKSTQKNAEAFIRNTR